MVKSMRAMTAMKAMKSPKKPAGLGRVVKSAKEKWRTEQHTPEWQYTDNNGVWDKCDRHYVTALLMKKKLQRSLAWLALPLEKHHKRFL